MADASVELSGEGELLALASVDMRQAAAAARLWWLRADSSERRALEAAIATCYARAFNKSRGSRTLKKKWRPIDSKGRELHRRLLRMRNQVYAHTDPRGGRSAVTTITFDSDGSVLAVSVSELWTPFRSGDVESVIALCDAQAARFESAAADTGLARIGEVR
jgi:hypothetical protein